MFFVAPCPSCKKKLRFPLDRGKIRVSCTCGYSFIADPDDPQLYKNGSFDLKGARQKESLYKKFFAGIQVFSFSDFTGGLASRLINIKYKLQNFQLLPAPEQKKLVVRGIIIFLIILFLVYILLSSQIKPSVDSNII